MSSQRRPGRRIGHRPSGVTPTHERTSRADRGGRLVQLLRRLVAAAAHRVGDAVRDVVIEQLQGDRLQCLGRRRHLLEDVDAVAVLVDHALDAPHLAFDPAQPLLDRFLVVDVARPHGVLLLVAGTQYPHRVYARRRGVTARNPGVGSVLYPASVVAGSPPRPWRWA